MSDLRLDRRSVTELNAVVSDVRDVGPARVLRCRPDGGALRVFQPGQYTSLGLPHPSGEEGRFLKRAYSLAHPILTDDGRRLIGRGEMDFYEFYIRRVPPPVAGEAQLTPALFDLRAGDSLFVSTKMVGFHTLAAVEPDRNVLLISTETGEAPHNSIVWQLLGEGRPVKVGSLVLGEPGWTSAYESVHRSLEERFPNYRIHMRDYVGLPEFLDFLMELLDDPVRSREVIGWSLSAADSHVFLCGDPEVIGAPKKRGAWKLEDRDGAVQRLLSRDFTIETKFTSGSITHEAYW